MLWFAAWVVLVLAAAGMLFLLVRSLWLDVKALTRELGAATDRLTEISDRLSSLDPAGPGHVRDVRSPGRHPLSPR